MSVLSRFTGWFSSLFTSPNDKNSIKINSNNTAKGDLEKPDSSGTATRVSSNDNAASTRSYSGGGSDFPFPLPPSPGMFRDFGPPHGPFGF